ncbi:MAG: S-methyl-5-thioribose-1-phosphate isomerase [Gammaproteobacteria bacterium]|nr:S-methyl-5-thioribose-1-phosphate isomerase [Gammaproteobacteria bacterium]
MKQLETTALRYSNGALDVLDQRRLPGEVHWHRCQDGEDLVALIQGLAIRGAPLIGVAAALWVGHCAERDDERDKLIATISQLRSSRPTAVNLMNDLDRLLNQIDKGADNATLVEEAIAIIDEDIALCVAMSEHGAALLQDGDNILTHCNTGGLATAGVGTALGVIITAHQQGKNISVWVDETRPLLQGARLTTWELEQAGVPYRLICDSTAASLMAQGKVDSILVGADRIACNGDFANKVGTYSVAVLAKYHGIPFYVVAPQTTVDLNCMHGDTIPIELRNANEVRGASGSFGSCTWSPTDAAAYNPAFDVTPAELVSGWILDSGVYTHEQVKAGALVSGDHL